MAVITAAVYAGVQASTPPGPPPVPVHAVETLPARGQEVAHNLFTTFPTGQVAGQPVPKGDQLALLEVTPSGETAAAWMPDSNTVCTIWYSRLGVRPDSPPADLDAYMSAASCGRTPTGPEPGTLIDGAEATDGESSILVPTGPDEPVVYTQDPYGITNTPCSNSSAPRTAATAAHGHSNDKTPGHRPGVFLMERATRIELAL